MIQKPDDYYLYITAFAAIRSGLALHERNLQFLNRPGLGVQHTEDGLAAMALAADDLKQGKSLRTRDVFEDGLQALVSV